MLLAKELSTRYFSSGAKGTYKKCLQAHTYKECGVHFFDVSHTHKRAPQIPNGLAPVRRYPATAALKTAPTITSFLRLRRTPPPFQLQKCVSHPFTCLS